MRPARRMSGPFRPLAAALAAALACAAPAAAQKPAAPLDLSPDPALGAIIEQNLRTRGLAIAAPRTPLAPGEMRSIGVAPPLPDPKPRNLVLGADRPARIWLHVSTPAQWPEAAGLVPHVGDSLALAKGERALAMQSIQRVDGGPATPEVRYFLAEDRETAEALAARLAPFLPGVRAADYSADFAGVSWIDPGHIEVWFSR
ncbi:hypothetical protein [Rubrimonas cliftonensis]|uniref:Uncharacterized protein n=1 Tax=Rubrimonas cliftonensis TaxID=89524 RepID=A0A1H4CGA1_9RHOB|nr:hypothetical protein [Rubrimonas cliftonensis]SEA59349.1 hypothetical protein SAMN05444370_10759 [Rubrimonas cliftonensis]